VAWRRSGFPWYVPLLSLAISTTPSMSPLSTAFCMISSNVAIVFCMASQHRHDGMDATAAVHGRGSLFKEVDSFPRPVIEGAWSCYCFSLWATHRTYYRWLYSDGTVSVWREWPIHTEPLDGGAVPRSGTRTRVNEAVTPSTAGPHGGTLCVPSERVSVPLLPQSDFAKGGVPSNCTPAPRWQRFPAALSVMTSIVHQEKSPPRSGNVPYVSIWAVDVARHSAAL